MANLTEDGNYTTTGLGFSCSPGLGTAQKIFISTINLPLSIFAIIGNLLIIITLRKVSCLHPPSKLLLSCLACTDLGVGLISQPLYSVFFMAPEHSRVCFFSSLLFLITGSIFCGVSSSTMTAISVDRLLALSLGLRYKQVVTMRRVKALVGTHWVLYTIIMLVAFQNYSIFQGIVSAIVLLGIMISSFCYTKIYRTLRLSQAQVQSQGHQGQQNEEATPLNKARYKKKVSTALWVQMALLVCYLPLALVSGFASITDHDPPLFNFVSSLSISLTFSNSTINPILYCWRMREMKRAVKHTIRQFCCYPNEET
ncbi:unnamed protein product [Pocillopora meandrina]|uniref:G-protein coupled receptors family 1 profile domain-containing protein n=1 Tax=Pocillopora meandrina TaxID=46732 RepID=A0AAU9VUE7_9CNID|nr:unnamed protein product [Pocillopora meandrina]